MDKSVMPNILSYTLIVHSGSYQKFLNEIKEKCPKLLIKYIKRVATHYYLIVVSESKGEDIDKRTIYNLPIMGLREEFSNYIFFKSEKIYGNIKRFMLKGLDEQEYRLAFMLLTPLERLKMSTLQNTSQRIVCKYMEEGKQKEMIWEKSASLDLEFQNILFCANEIIIDNDKVDYLSCLKKQHIVIGILK